MILPNKRHFFFINPQPSRILTILDELDSFGLHINNLRERLEAEAMLKIPEIVKQTKLVIEFADCLIEAQDLVSYKMIVDDDEDRKIQRFSD